MITTRRMFLRAAAAGAALLALPKTLLAWPEKAFESESTDAAMKELFGSSTATASDAVTLTAPDIAENGAVVPVTVESDVEGAKSISIIASGNGTPLIASFELGDNAVPFVSTRIKMAKTSDVVAVVQTDSGLLSAAKPVKVTIGGCGG